MFEILAGCINYYLCEVTDDLQDTVLIQLEVKISLEICEFV